MEEEFYRNEENVYHIDKGKLDSVRGGFLFYYGPSNTRNTDLKQGKVWSNSILFVFVSFLLGLKARYHIDFTDT